MPTTSPAQERLMQAAAHTPGGYDGVPQNVGKEFVSDSADITEAAGIAFMARNRILLLKRGGGGDYAGHWSFPGGKLELGEIAEEAARREVMEETGYVTPGAVRQLAYTDNGAVRFTTYGRAVTEFTPVLCDENTDFGWFALDELPQPMHPGTQLILDGGALDQIDISKMNELDVARRIAAGEMTSPQRYGNMSLFALRITGTGTTYRSKGNEFVYRPPEKYLTEEFLQRCNGLAVIFVHPEKNILDSVEYSERSIGSIFLPYIQGEEVWGVAKIYDDASIQIMTERQMSTSPTVVLRGKGEDNKVTLENGDTLLIEGVPFLLDHLAICELGVWDKGGDPKGVLNSTGEALKMTDEEKKAAEDKAKADAENFAEMKAKADALQAKCDSLEAEAKSRADADEEAKAKQVVADKAKADAEEEEKAKADSARVDAIVEKRLAEFKAQFAGQIPKAVSDEDHAAMAEAQSRADSVAHAFGEAAPRPLAGEDLTAYRKRLAAKFQSHSPSWKTANLSAISDAATLDIAEKQIYADAMVAAMSPEAPAGGGLREIKTRSPAGHMVSTFVGAPSAWTDQFKLQGRVVSNINKGA